VLQHLRESIIVGGRWWGSLEGNIHEMTGSERDFPEKREIKGRERRKKKAQKK